MYLLFFFFFSGEGEFGCVGILRHLGGRGEEGKGRGRGRGRNKKREKFLTIVNISKKKYMPKNAYFIPSNICRSVLLPPPLPPTFPPPLPAALPPTPFDDDPAKIFSQAISQQGYHFNNRKYLLPDDDIHIISFSFSFLFLLQIPNKKIKKKKKSHRAQQNRQSLFCPPLRPTAYSLLRVMVVVLVVIYLHTQSQFSP